jgi:hypothetical protein
MRSLAAASLGLAAATFVVGCGSGNEFETAPAAGRVTLDGKPVAEGSVVTTPAQGWPARGELDADGRFTLSTYKPGDGAILGPHEIVVIAQSGPDPSEHFERPPPAPTKWLIPERYGSRATSGLSFTVEKGRQNEINLELFTDPRRAAGN